MASRWARAAGMVGLATTVAGLIVAFLPTSDVEDVWFFELKLLAGVLAPLAVGWYLFQRAARRAARRMSDRRYLLAVAAVACGPDVRVPRRRRPPTSSSPTPPSTP